MIGVTEPRRVAAIAMSQRVAKELNLSTRLDICSFISACVYVCVYVCVYARTHTYMYVCTSVYLVCVCMCTFTQYTIYTCFVSKLC